MEELDRAARSVIDSTFMQDVPAQPRPAPVEDSLYVISKDKELQLLKYNGADSLEYDPVSGKYVSQKPEYYVKDVRLNIEQDNYMWYLRDNLVLPDVRLAKNQQASAKAREIKKDKEKKKSEKKGLKGFFRNLFKKQQKTTDSTEIPPPPRPDEFDFIDADPLTQNEPRTEDPEAKKGFFSPRKKKSKDQDTVDPASTGNSDKKKKKSKTKEAAEKKKEKDED